MIGGGHWRSVAEANNEPRPVFAELDREFHAGFEGVEQPAVRQVQQRAQMDAQGFAGGLGLCHSHVGARREWRRLAIRQVDDANFVAGVDQAGERSSAGDFHIIRMGPHGDYV